MEWEAKKDKIQSNQEYWQEKIERNITRDIETNKTLCAMGWTVVRFWGSEIIKDVSGCVEDIKDVILQHEVEKSFLRKRHCSKPSKFSNV
jgi:DNA mismatch endonuclease (patch repair protein)